MAALLLATGWHAAAPSPQQAHHIWRTLALSSSMLSSSSSSINCFISAVKQQQEQGVQVEESNLTACQDDRSRLLSSWHASTSKKSPQSTHQFPGRAFCSSAAPQVQQGPTQQHQHQQQASSPSSTAGWVPFTKNPAVKPRKPEDVVGEDSWLVKNYKRNMPPRQLVHRISKRADPISMMDTLKVYQTKIDGIAVAASVAKLMRMQRYPASYPHADPAMAAALMAWLLPFAQFQLRYCNARTLVALLWAWASLKPGSQERDAWPRDLAAIMVERCTRDPLPGQPHRLSKLSPDRLALLTWSAGRLLGQAPPLLQPPGHGQAPPLSGSSGSSSSVEASSPDTSTRSPPSRGSSREGAAPHDVASMAHALSFWGTRRLEHFSVERLGILAYGLALLQPRTSTQGLEQIAGEAAARSQQQVEFPGFTRADCVRLAVACAAGGVRHPALFASLASAALPSLKHWPAQDAGALAAAFGAVRIRHEALLEAATSAVLTHQSPDKRRAASFGTMQQRHRHPNWQPPRFVGGSPDVLGLPGLGADVETTPEAAAQAAAQVLGACRVLEHGLSPDTAKALAAKANLSS